jgi:hypothetical protein
MRFVSVPSLISRETPKGISVLKYEHFDTRTPSHNPREELRVKPDSSNITITDALLHITNARVAYPNVVLCEDDAIIDANNGYLSSELPRHNLASFPLQITSSKSLAFTPPRTAIKFAQPIFLITSWGNYSSDILGEIGRLRFFELGAAIVIHGDAKPYLADYINLILPEVPVIQVDRSQGIIAKSLYFATPTYHHHAISPASIDFLSSHAPNTPAKFGEKIYLSRSRLGEIHDRKIQNENELEELLKAHGFTVIFPEHLNLEEQMNVFRNSKILISPFGATWANIVFSSSNQRCLIISTKSTPEFLRIASSRHVQLQQVTPRGIKVRNGVNMSKSFEFHLDDSHINEIAHWCESSAARNA